MDKEYHFDEFLTSLDIKYIDREIVNMTYQEVRCDRCNAQLRYVNTLRIDEDYYNIGDFCYDSIKVKLSEIRGKSLHKIRIALEEPYNRYLEDKYSYENFEMESNGDGVGVDKSDYSKYLSLKWDLEHSGLHPARKSEYEILKEKYEK